MLVVNDVRLAVQLLKRVGATDGPLKLVMAGKMSTNLCQHIACQCVVLLIVSRSLEANKQEPVERLRVLGVFLLLPLAHD